MAISNKFGSMVLTTGNKSEMSVGYATLYGDMNGGYNPIKDVYKTEVYRLAGWRNQHRPKAASGPSASVIPERIITKAPDRRAAARTRRTRTSLPPYDVLDDILAGSSSTRCSVAEIVKREAIRGASGEARRAPALIAEYKRRQAAPGRQDHAAQFRPRPPLSDHQRLSRSVMQRQRQPDRRPLRALADRAAPYRQCPHRAAQLAVRAQAWRRASCCASTIPTASARPTNSTAAIAADSHWLGIDPDLIDAPVRAVRPSMTRAAEHAEGSGPALSLLRDARRSSTAGASASSARGLPPVYDRAALKLDATTSAPELEAEGRKPHWRFRLEQPQGRAGTTSSAGRSRSTPPRCPIRCWCARTAAISTRCPRWSTTSISASPMSSAARTMSSTPRCRSRCSRRSAAEPPQFAHHSLLTGADGKGLSKRLGSLSIAGMREQGHRGDGGGERSRR